MEKAKIDMKIYELRAELSKTLSHPLRRVILHFLKDGEKTVNDLKEIIGIPQPNISQHLGIMRK